MKKNSNVLFILYQLFLFIQVSPGCWFPIRLTQSASSVLNHYYNYPYFYWLYISWWPKTIYRNTRSQCFLLLDHMSSTSSSKSCVGGVVDNSLCRLFGLFVKLDRLTERQCAAKWLPISFLSITRVSNILKWLGPRSRNKPVQQLHKEEGCHSYTRTKLISHTQQHGNLILLIVYQMPTINILKIDL